MAKNKKLTIFLSTIFSLVFSTSLAGATELTSNNSNIDNALNLTETKTDTTKNNNDDNDTNKEMDTTDNKKNDNNENIKTINVDKIITKNIDNNSNNNIDTDNNIDTNNNNYDKNNLNYENENNLNLNENISDIINKGNLYSMPSYRTDYQNNEDNIDNKALKIETIEDTKYKDGSTKKSVTTETINKTNQFGGFEPLGEGDILETNTRQNTKVVSRKG